MFEMKQLTTGNKIRNTEFIQVVDNTIYMPVTWIKDS